MKRNIVKTFITISILSMQLSTGVLYAQSEHSHEGHNHHIYKDEVTNTAVKKIAKDEVLRLATEKKIPKSWKSMPITKLGKTHHSYTNDWVVVFENDKVKRKSKQILYIFVSVTGKIMGANYTGN